MTFKHKLSNRLALMRDAARSVAAALVVVGCAADDAPVAPGVQAPSPAGELTAMAPVVLVGAGDIANCSTSSDEATARLLDGIAGTVFTAGDNAYPDATTQQFQDCYDPTWGRHRARTRPAPGNHDYHQSGAAPYYAYFGANAGPAGQGYYSYDLGDWHIISLNSNIAMSAGSTQERWLRADLAASTKRCTMAYWHHPRFSSGEHGSSASSQSLWQALYDAGAEIILAGHDHNYERFAPQTPSGARDDTRGLRQFVVGTGGTSLRSVGTPVANSEVRNSTAHGVLKLSLSADSYTWEFVPIAGQTFRDSGSGPCWGSADSSAAVASVTVTPTAATVDVGKAMQLAVVVKDASGNVVTGRPVSWASSTPSVATVSASGLVTGVAVGSASITATSEGKNGTAAVTVSGSAPPAPVCLTNGASWLNSAFAPQAGVFTLQFDATPSTAGIDGVTGVSPDGATDYTALAAIVRFNVTGTIDARNGGAYTAAQAIPYAAGRSHRVRLVIDILRRSYAAYVTPSGGVEQTIGTAYAFRTEQSGATALGNWASKTGGGTLALCNFSITGTPIVAVASVTVSPATGSLEVGKAVQLGATLKDSAGAVLTGRTVSWSSSTPSVATVSPSGLVTGVAAGSATITATSEGKSASAAFTVSIPVPVAVASVSVTPATAAIEVGKTASLAATPKDSAGNVLTGRTVTWASSNSSVASVSASGLVTGVAVGSATITATSGGKSGTATITVTGSATPAPMCLTNGASWLNSAFAPQAGVFTVQFDATPSAAGIDGVTGVSPGGATDYTALAAIVRFNVTGTIDARNGGAYTAAQAIPYAAGRSHRVRLVIDIPRRSYAAYVTPPGGVEQTIGTAYAFRTEQSGATALGNWASKTGGGTLTLCNFNMTSDGTVPPPPPPPPPPPAGDLGVALPPPLAPSNGTAYYVATSGSDGNPGTLGQPWKTIQKAMSALRPGEKAYVRAGTYETGGTFGTSGDSQFWSANCAALAPCSILAYPGERPVIHGWIKITGSYLRLSGFIIEGPLSRDETSCSERRAMQIEFSGGHHVEISQNEIRNNDYHAGIYLSGVNNVHLIGNYIHDNGRFTITADPCTGSWVWNVDHGVYWARNSGGGNLMANNVIAHNRGYGVQFYPSAADVLVVQNTFVENGNAGIFTYEAADRITAINNVSAFNERSKQIRLVSGNANVVRRNIVYSPNSSLNGIENNTSSEVTDNVMADPRFMDRAGRDFRLQTGSPAIDWALFAYSALVDHLRRVRPLGAAPDGGAFER